MPSMVKSGGGISFIIAAFQPATPPLILRYFDSANDSTCLPIFVLNSSIDASLNTRINSGTHSIGKSRNQGL